MKIRNSFLACAFLLLFGAGLAGAAPSPASPAEPTAVLADLFGASVLSSSQDCSADDLPQADGLDSSTCGSCSASVCRGQAVNNVCGFANGKFQYCQDYLGLTCPADGGARCRCSSDPIP